MFFWVLPLLRKYLVLFCRLPFILSPVALLYRFYLDEVLIVYFSLCFLCLLRGALLAVAAGEEKKFLLEFTSRILMKYYLRFRNFIHFEIFCVFGVAEWSTFILMPVAVQFFFSDPFIDEIFFLRYFFLSS